ncbi:hypothetical protein, variant [Blastomyces gilchristii SLH14081]|uniref:SPRY domain-containing protein n=1 Tax=Blastomyces gilchristii (strain SLH14081) TaxID=559298 RepID=A0A179UEG3_BLAGS|nr:uncharacterized protein BDBG_02016 [Blastomyces gilchristii SLH14081]XP_031576819.1 hypothetical protein, variant [Blastomyces gilchristii SLH14081]OAT05658.1 hypothetical protein BDBG_02016 [Blastomyces gilchristii SLH14081]OAT05659.1 hypothetical protein, variant [Blastomyces gilchristii SLH14081]
MAFFCCRGADKDERAAPSRPIENSSSQASKQQPSKCPPPMSFPPSIQQATPNLSALSTGDEKQRVFGPNEAIVAGPSTIPEISEGATHQKSEPLIVSRSTGATTATAGPPPGYQDRANNKNTKAPQGNPPPYHNWEEAVPDTAVFPPPPIGGYLYSNTGNASEEDADRAHDFCDNTPLWTPYTPSDAVYNSVQNFDLRPVRPEEYNGSLEVVNKGMWRGRTQDQNGDCILLTGLPVYFPAKDSPLVTERPKTIYFEAKLLAQHSGINGQTSGFAIGFAAQPYPTWRSPGWERGSVGVFSDDGCRFVNDSWGGMEFTSPFKVGETIGLGMKFPLPSPESFVQSQATGASPTLPVEIFFTRDGKIVGSWDLHEEVDEDTGGVEGLEGDFDLYGALGLFGGVEFEVCFNSSGWLWVPPTTM